MPCSTCEKARALVAAQAKDEGIWFTAETAPESYLQQEIRRLHAVVEDAAVRKEHRESPRLRVFRDEYPSPGYYWRRTPYVRFGPFVSEDEAWANAERVCSPGPIHHRGYVIERNVPSAREWLWTFRHEDFDPGPWEVGGPPMDERHGDAKTLEEAVADIDEQIEEVKAEGQEPPE